MPYYKTVVCEALFVHHEEGEEEGMFIIKLPKENFPALNELSFVEDEMMSIHVEVQQRVPALLKEDYRALVGEEDANGDSNEREG